MVAQAHEQNTTALIAASVSLLSLILLLAAPFGFLDPEGADNTYTVSLAEAEQFAVSNWGNIELFTIAAVLMVVGSVVAYLVSRVRLPSSPLRAFLWLSTFIMAAGAVIGLVSTSLWVGGGMGGTYFANEESGVDAPATGNYDGGLIGIFQNIAFDANSAGNFWMLSPVVLFLASAGVFFLALRMNTRMATEEHRPKIAQYNRYAMLATGVVIVAFLLPWSVGDFGDKTYIGAQEMLYQNDATQAATEPLWETISYVFNTFILGALVLTAIAQLNAIINNDRVLFAPAAFFMAWILGAFIASWFKSWVIVKDAEGFTPAYLQLGVVIPLAFMAFFAGTHFLSRLDNNDASLEAHAVE